MVVRQNSPGVWSVILALQLNVTACHIDAFNQRLEVAKQKLSKLPASSDSWMARQKLNAQRKFLQSEIVHVQRLIDMAEGACGARGNGVASMKSRG
jgi:hypothetical protein